MDGVHSGASNPQLFVAESGSGFYPGYSSHEVVHEHLCDSTEVCWRNSIRSRLAFSFRAEAQFLKLMFFGERPVNRKGQ